MLMLNPESRRKELAVKEPLNSCLSLTVPKQQLKAALDFQTRHESKM